MVILDACIMGAKPGEIGVVPLETAIMNTENLFMSHDLSFFNWAKLCGRGFDGLFIGIEPYSIDFGLDLSDDLEKSFLKLADKIENLINDYFTLLNGFPAELNKIVNKCFRTIL